jgi:hypothetical protein
LYQATPFIFEVLFTNQWKYREKENIVNIMESSERNKALVDPIKLREIRTGTDALCLHDVHAFLVQCPNDLRVKRNFDRLVSNNQDDFPLTLQTLQDDTTTFEPTAGHPRRTKLNAIRTPTRLVEVIREYLQHFKKKSSKPNHNTPSYDSTKVQARLLANQSLWWCTDVNVHALLAPLLAPLFEGPTIVRKLPRRDFHEYKREEAPSPTSQTWTAGQPPQVSLNFFQRVKGMFVSMFVSE